MLSKTKKQTILPKTVTIGMVFVFLIFGLEAQGKTSYSKLEREIINQLNQERVDHGLSTLTYNPQLKQAADLKLADMIKYNYFSHTSPKGKKAWYWFDKVQYNYKFAGENLATNFTTAVGVHKAWMNSPKHRDNILFPDYNEVAVAITKDKKDRLVAVELFGKPADKTVTLGKVKKQLSQQLSLEKNTNNKQKTFVAQKTESIELSNNKQITKGTNSDIANIVTDKVTDKIKSEEQPENINQPEEIREKESQEAEDKYNNSPFLATTIIPPNNFERYDFNNLDLVLLLVGLLCFILIINIWLLEKEDEKILQKLIDSVKDLKAIDILQTPDFGKDNKT